MSEQEKQLDQTPPEDGITEQDIIEYAEAIEAKVTEELEFDKFVTEANVARYRAQTTRLAILSDFACRQISKIGAWRPSDSSGVDEEDFPSRILKAREQCVVAVLQAISRIAKESHLPPERGKKASENSVPNDEPEDDFDGEL